MHLYRALWWALVGPLAAFGVLIACTRLPGTALAPFMTYTAVLGLVVPAIRRRRRALRQQSEPPQPRSGAHALRTALLVTLAGVALLGLMTSTGIGAIALAALLTAGSPARLEHHRRTSQQCPDQARTPAPTWPSAADGSHPVAATNTAERRPEAMTLDELCRAWTASHQALLRPRDVAAHGRLVDARQHYLDEMERRDPDAFNLWLHAGAHAVSDPSRYLGRGSRH